MGLLFGDVAGRGRALPLHTDRILANNLVAAFGVPTQAASLPVVKVFDGFFSALCRISAAASASR
jgi:hypothetical protein